MKTWEGTIVVAYKTLPNRILLITNKVSGKITCPGGALELGEDATTAARREIKEEVEWEISPTDLISTGIKHEFIYGPNKPERAGDSGTNEIFLLNADNLPEPKETNDTHEATWLEIDEGLEKMSFKDVAPLVKRALEQGGLI